MSTPIPGCPNDTGVFRDDEAFELARADVNGFATLNKLFAFFTFAFCVFCMVIWFMTKNKYEWTRLRPSGLVLMTCSAAIVNALGNHLPGIVTENPPCFIIIFILITIIPLVAGSLIARLIIFYFLSTYSKEAAQTALAKISETGFAFDIMDSDDELQRLQSRCSQLVNATMLAIKVIFFLDPFKAMADMKDKTKALDALRFMTSAWGVTLLSLILTLPFLIVALIILLVDPEYSRCSVCENARTSTIYAMIAIGIWTCILGFVLWFRVRHLVDPWGLRAESFWGLCCAILAMIFFLIDVFAHDANVKGNYVAYYLLTASITAMVWVNSIQQLLIGWKLERHSRQTRQLRISSTASTNSLDDILTDPIKAQAFERHLVSELGVESLLFIRDAENWKRSYYDIAPSARKARAKKMHATYIVTSGIYAVNIPDGMNKEITRAINLPEDDVPANLFDAAVKEIKNLLTVGAVARFMDSDTYRELAGGKSTVMPTGGGGLL